MDLSFANYVNARTMKQLKELCRTLDLSQCGSRTELQKRVHSYVTAVGYDRTGWADFAGLPPPPAPPAQDQSFKCICLDKHADNPQTLVKCSRCTLAQHKACVEGCLELSPYECPKCQLEQMDPFLALVEFLSPPTRVGYAGGSSAAIDVIVTPSAMTNLRGDEGGFHIQIRCLRLDAGGYTHAWPGETLISLNDSQILDLHPNSQNCIRKRKDYPLDLGIDLAKDKHNVGVWKRRDESEYVFAVVLTRKREVVDLLNDTLKGTVLSLKDGKTFVSTYFGLNEELRTESWRQTLRCPLTHLIVEIPVRGWKCKHVQCFDLKSFLLLQEETTVNKWRCPVCQLSCVQLVMDKYMERILLEAKKLGECDIVEFRQTGDYCLIQTIGESEPHSKKRRHAGHSPKPPRPAKPVTPKVEESLAYGDPRRTELTKPVLPPLLPVRMETDVLPVVPTPQKRPSAACATQTVKKRPTGSQVQPINLID